jgi:flagellar hook-associated protein FlgK
MNFEIGVSGLNVAQQALSLIATNVANAATEGYHRQTPVIVPNEFITDRGVVLGGADLAAISRHTDTLIEKEVLRQQPELGQLSQELIWLQALEGAMGSIDEEGLAAAIGQFFSALQKLAGQAESRALREQAIWAADGVGMQFRSLASSMDSLAENVHLRADLLVDEVNALSHEVAKLNGEIRAVEIGGGNANLLRDRRDEAIKQLTELVPVQLENIDPTAYMSNVVAWGTPLVTGTTVTEIESSMLEDGTLGISVKDVGYYLSDLRGGRLGALLGLRNEILPEIRSTLDTIAGEIASRINQVHVQAVGRAGSFTQLEGVSVPSDPVDQWDLPVTSGDFRIRLIDPAGSATMYTVTVDAATDTVTTIAAKISALDPAHLMAATSASMLSIQALGGYQFDFLPEIAADTSALGPGAPEVSVEGIYSGPANQTYTVTVGMPGGGSGQVGIDEGLSLTVRDGDGEIAKILNVGAGYASGELLEVQHDIKLSLGAGTLSDGDVFSLEALAESDETGFLAAAGINTLFEGHSADTIEVRQALLEDSDLLATAIGPEMSDNVAVLRMIEVGETSVPALGNVSCGDAYRILVADVGQKIAIREARKASLEDILQQLANQRDDISGVNINEEAARMIVFEQMFQAMAKVVSTQQTALQSLMDLL